MLGAAQFALIGMQNVGASIGRLKAAGKSIETQTRKAMTEIAKRCYEASIDYCRGMVYMDAIGSDYVFTGTLLKSHYIKPIGAGGTESFGAAFSAESIDTAAISGWSQFGFSVAPKGFGRISPGEIMGYIIGNNADQGEGGYAPFVHDGTFAMHPRPWMEKAIMDNYEQASSFLDNSLVKGVKGVFAGA